MDKNNLDEHFKSLGIDLDKHWITRDGTKIKYADLGDKHLLNIHKMLLSEFGQSVKGVQKEIEKRKLLGSRFAPFNNVIQVCSKCGRVDVVAGHELECDPTMENQRQINLGYYD